MLGDARHLPLKDKSINSIITSPPYWSLRKYDIPDLIWDGDEGCKHNFEMETVKTQAISDKTGLHNDGRKNPVTPKYRETLDGMSQFEIQRGFCSLCSAWRGQLGLEPTINLYLKHLMQIMDECKRVLRDDGTMFINLGDSYSGSNGTGYSETKWKSPYPGNEPLNPGKQWNVPTKSLSLIPYRFAIEMVDRGWILRNIIVWHKPNCMPSSVKDRFTVDFEPVFFFVKSRKYWFKQQYEPIAESTIGRGPVDFGGKKGREYKPNNSDPNYRAGNEQWGRTFNYKESCKNGRNRRCVWTISTQSYPESHFATFPEALIEPMIKAGCPKGGITLDPFCGSGTTTRVAEKLNRVGIGFDLAYEELQKKRMKLIQREFF